MRKTAPCYSKQDYYGYFEFKLKNKRILDIGSSIGSFKKSGRFNSSERKLDDAKAYITMDINPDSGADIIGDAHHLPFKNSEFDIIVANNVIEHFYDPHQAVGEMRRVLKKGGVIYYTVPFLYPVHEAPHDYARFTEFGLKKLFEDFTQFELHRRGGFFSTTAHFFYKMTHVFDKVALGEVVRAITYPLLWLWVQLDRFDNTKAFVRVYFGKVKK